MMVNEIQRLLVMQDQDGGWLGMSVGVMRGIMVGRDDVKAWRLPGLLGDELRLIYTRRKKKICKVVFALMCVYCRGETAIWQRPVGELQYTCGRL